MAIGNLLHFALLNDFETPLSYLLPAFYHCDECGHVERLSRAMAYGQLLKKSSVL